MTRHMVHRLRNAVSRRDCACWSITESTVGSEMSPTDHAVGEEHHTVGVRRRDRVVGDHHDGLAEVAHRLAHEAAGSRRPTLESRLPVGSSAKITSGLLTRARATATRCCWPPESSLGRWLTRSARWTVSMTWASHSGSGLRPARASGSVMFSSAGERGHEVVGLEDEADLVAPHQRELLLVHRADLVVAEEHLARRDPVEAGEAVQQRRLARARRAHDRGELAACGTRPRRRRARSPRCRRCRRPW